MGTPEYGRETLTAANNATQRQASYRMIRAYRLRHRRRLEKMSIFCHPLRVSDTLFSSDLRVHGVLGD